MFKSGLHESRLTELYEDTLRLSGPAENFNKQIRINKQFTVSHRGWAAVKPQSGRLSGPSMSWWRLPGPGAPPARGPTLSCPPAQDSPPCTGAELQNNI